MHRHVERKVDARCAKQHQQMSRRSLPIISRLRIIAKFNGSIMSKPSHAYFRLQELGSHIEKYVRLGINDPAWDVIHEGSDPNRALPLEVLEVRGSGMRPILHEHQPVKPSDLRPVRDREKLITLVVLWAYAIQTHLDPQDYRKSQQTLDRDREVSAALINEGGALLASSRVVRDDPNASDMERGRAHVNSLRALSLYAESNVIAWPYTVGHRLDERTRILKESLESIKEAEAVMNRLYPDWDTTDSPAREMERSR